MDVTASSKTKVIVERLSEQIEVLRMNNLQKGFAHGFWNSRSEVLHRTTMNHYGTAYEKTKRQANTLVAGGLLPESMKAASRATIH